MSFFNNVLMEFWEPSESEEYDPYIDSNLIKYKLNTVALVDMQPYTPKDSIREFGKVLQNTFKIYTDISCTENCILRKSGDTITYSITGSPQFNNHFGITTHYKLIVTQERETRKL